MGSQGLSGAARNGPAADQPGMAASRGIGSGDFAGVAGHTSNPRPPGRCMRPGRSEAVPAPAPAVIPVHKLAADAWGVAASELDTAEPRAPGMGGAGSGPHTKRFGRDPPGSAACNTVRQPTAAACDFRESGADSWLLPQFCKHWSGTFVSCHRCAPQARVAFSGSVLDGGMGWGCKAGAVPWGFAGVAELRA